MSHRFPARVRALITALALGVAVPVLGVAVPAQAAPPPPLPVQVVRILDNAGVPIEGAVIQLSSRLFAVADADGEVDLTTVPGIELGREYEMFLYANTFADFWDSPADPADTQRVVPTIGAARLDVNTQTTNPQPSATVGGISGTVTDALTGEPVPGVLLNANIYEEGTGSGNSQTRNDGTFYLGFTADPMPNQAILTFLPLLTSPSAPYGYGIQDWDEVFDWENEPSTPIAINPNSTTTGIDVQLVPHGQLTGRVTAVSGSSVVGVFAQVSVFDRQTGIFVDGGATDSDGRYAFPVAPGDWVVKFERIVDGNVAATQFYNGAADIASAALVTITATESTDGIDAQFGTLPTPPPTPAVLPVTGASDTLLTAGLGAFALALGTAVLVTARTRARRAGR